MRREHQMRRAVEARRLELELNATIVEQLEPLVTDRGQRAYDQAPLLTCSPTSGYNYCS